MNFSRFTAMATAAIVAAVWTGGNGSANATASCDDEGCYRKAISTPDI